jgi:hypothetical protein
MGDKVSNACLGCTDRRLGCHGECERYAIYREHREAMLEARERFLHDDAYFALKQEKIKQMSTSYKKKQERR